MVGMNLLEALLKQHLTQTGQLALVGVDAAHIEVLPAGHAPDEAPVDILQGDGARGGGFAVSLNAGDGPLHRVVLAAQGADLLVDLLVLPRQNILNEGDVLLLQHAADLRQAHTQLLHVGNHIQPGVLVHVIIAVARFLIHIAGTK